MIVPNVILPFDGANASIPGGYSRDTRFDNRFPRGSNVGIGGLGGVATHLHGFSHTHTIGAHTHLADVHNERDAQETISANRNPDKATTGHDHPGGAETGSAQTQASGTTNITYQTISNDPPYYKVIFIKSNGYNSIPKYGIVFKNGTSRQGMSVHIASDNRFLKGASTGANAGGNGGTTSHDHTQSHTHTATNHDHNTGNLHGYSGDSAEPGVWAAKYDGQSHGGEHHFGVSGAKQNMNSNATKSSNTAIVPLHRTLRHFMAFNPESISQTYNKDLVIFPNPTKGSVTLAFESRTILSYTIDLVDITGRKLATYRGNASEGENTRVLDLESIEAGMYQVVLILDGKREVKKLIID